jgi:hypothetical protein
MVNCNNGSSGFQVMALQISETKFRLYHNQNFRIAHSNYNTPHLLYLVIGKHKHCSMQSIDYTRTNIIIFPTYGGHCTVFVNMAKQEAVIK